MGVPKKWQVVGSRYLISNPFLKVRQDEVVLPDGTRRSDYFVDERRGWVSVFCLTEGGMVLLTRQYKHGIREIVLELPGGTIEDDDPSPAEVALRELQEETGYSAETLEEIGRLAVNPTSSTGYYHIFLGRRARKTSSPQEVASEIIEILALEPRAVLDLVREGVITGQGNVAAIYMASDALGLL